MDVERRSNMQVESNDAVDNAAARSVGAPVQCVCRLLRDDLDAVDSRLLAEFARRAVLWVQATGGPSVASTEDSPPVPISRETIRELFAVIDTLTRREAARRRRFPSPLVGPSEQRESGVGVDASHDWVRGALLSRPLDRERSGNGCNGEQIVPGAVQ
jgi:hypothetical protein